MSKIEMGEQFFIYFAIQQQEIFQYSIIRKMEEHGQIKKQQRTQKLFNVQMSQQLKKIDDIQKSITDLQAHIKFLLKRQSEEEKKIDKLYNNSIRVAATKIQHANEYAQSQQKTKQKIQQNNLKSSQIRQIREKEINLLRQTRLEISKMKQASRTELREMSKRNDQKIRKIKEEQKLKNQNKAINVKQTHMDRIEQMKIERQLSQKKKQEQILKKNLSRINEKDQMEKEIQKLKEKKQEIALRLQEKKAKQQKIHETTRAICSLDNQKVIEKAKKYRMQLKKTQEDERAQQIDKLQKQLFKSAVHKFQSKEPILLFR